MYLPALLLLMISTARVSGFATKHMIKNRRTAFTRIVARFLSNKQTDNSSHSSLQLSLQDEEEMEEIGALIGTGLSKPRVSIYFAIKKIPTIA